MLIRTAVSSKRGLFVAPDGGASRITQFEPPGSEARWVPGFITGAAFSAGPTRQALPSPRFGSDRLRICRERGGLAGVLGPGVKLFEMLLEGRGQA